MIVLFIIYLKANKHYEKESIESKMFLLVSSQILNVVSALAFFLPEGKVFLKKLDNGLSISEGLLVALVNLVKSVLESGLTEGTSFLVIVLNLIVEN